MVFGGMVSDGIAFARTLRQKWISLQSFVREAAAAGLLPCELLIKKKNVSRSEGQLRRCQSTRWTASDDRNGKSPAHVSIGDRTIEGDPESGSNSNSPARDQTPPPYWRVSCSAV